MARFCSEVRAFYILIAGMVELLERIAEVMWEGYIMWFLPAFRDSLARENS